MRRTSWMIALAMGSGLAAAAGCAVDDDPGDGLPPVDAAPGAEIDAGEGLASRCDTDVSTSTICLEAAAGRPGDTVEIEVHVLMDAARCGEFQEAFTVVEYDDEVFALASDEVDGDCFKLEGYEFSDGSRVVDWYVSADVDGDTDCPEILTPGSQGTIDFSIRDSAPEGDYPLALETATVEAAEVACDGYGRISGLIRVLPPG